MYSAEQINFIKQLAPYVQAQCIKRGYKVASPILAQASTESFKGQGLSQLASKYNNYFGMKAGSSWTGKVVNLGTGEEYTKGVITHITAGFRVYDNMEQGVNGYFDFINTKRYANLKMATTPEQYLQYIKLDGYATSSSYVATNLQRIAGMNLTRYDNLTSTIASGNPYLEPIKNLKYGSRGNDVRWLQYALNEHGAGLLVDGDFKRKTEKALIEFQKKAFPNDPSEWDGICGAKTRAKLT